MTSLILMISVLDFPVTFAWFRCYEYWTRADVLNP